MFSGRGMSVIGASESGPSYVPVDLTLGELPTTFSVLNKITLNAHGLLWRHRLTRDHKVCNRLYAQLQY